MRYSRRLVNENDRQFTRHPYAKVCFSKGPFEQITGEGQIMAWAGCNATGNAGFGLEFWILAAVGGAIALGEWAAIGLILLAAGQFLMIPFIKWLADTPENREIIRKRNENQAMVLDFLLHRK
jgi:hypothetical protein